MHIFPSMQERAETAKLISHIPAFQGIAAERISDTILTGEVRQSYRQQLRAEKRTKIFGSRTDNR